MKALACAILAAALTATASMAEAASPFTGKLWILPGSVTAKYPIPTSTPDATFSIKHLSLFSSAPGPAVGDEPVVDNMVGTFLSSADPITDLTFSGLSNPALGYSVSPTTPIVNSTSASCGTYTTYIEFTGSLRLIHNEFFYIGVDDGVSMMIDGNLVLSQTADGAVIYQFPGNTGRHSLDLVYSNVCGGGWLSFGPQM